MSPEETVDSVEDLLLIPREIPKFLLKQLIDLVYDIEITGLDFIPKTGGAVLICNHTDYLDVPVQGANISRKIVYLAKYELFHPQEDIMNYIDSPKSPFSMPPLSFTKPLIRTLLNRMGSSFSKNMQHWGGMPIIRNHYGESMDKRAAMDYYNQLEDYMVGILKSGEILSIYPEGTRSETGIMSPFKALAAKIAIRAGVPIIPSGISGAHKMSEPEAFISGAAFRAKIKYNIGQPIPVKDFPTGPEKKAAKELTEELEKRVYYLKDHHERRGKPRKFVTKL
ncbi:lysophospholipid acyltransferase family protein [Leptospira sp. GIMC2001]|uniref:lysophospholipid acyltransferase family protein n=1 Tax=Leptospira sp. GIMC2001 TaxID=1513297 RepID=UPI00234AC4BF|nr:lysophospholipid acyltransferase family protein [Leptospira sp. GIMC2001]WCL48783.1 lysophospholipid acyltransferase family protein [Leptospira sp. GIMC2001]